MLGQIEILLAFSAVMAALSLIITVSNQMVSAALNLRGSSLRWGLVSALQNIFPEMKARPQSGAISKTFADHIVEEVLTHPLISDSTLPVGYLNYWRTASVIRFDELSRAVTLMSRPELGNNPEVESWTYDDAMSWLSRRLIFLSDWFNVVTDRISQHFALYMHISTVVIAIFLTLVFHVDSVRLYKALNSDVKLRSGILANIDALQKANAELNQDNGIKAQNQKALETINSAAILEVAQSLDGPLAQAAKNPTIPGQLITIALLSLGAPFWFNLLKNLSNLRGTLAAKEEQERTAAQSTVEPAQPPAQSVAATTERNTGEF